MIASLFNVKLLSMEKSYFDGVLDYEVNIFNQEICYSK